MDTWAEVRRLHRCEGLPIKEIARRLDLARNTVRAALRAEGPPSRARPARGSVADAYEPAIRAVLMQFPRMPATVIAERIGWPYSITPLKRKLRTIRPEYVGVDPADRLSFSPGEFQEASIIAGMQMLLDRAGLVVEPSASLGIAAILEYPDRFAGRHVVTIVCGSNVDPEAYRRWVGATSVRRP